MTLVEWKIGQPLVWDTTCFDTLAPSYLPTTTSETDSAADTKEPNRANMKIRTTYTFMPPGLETSGSWGPEAWSFFRKISREAGCYFASKFTLSYSGAI